jgi:hypothetical protein
MANNDLTVDGVRLHGRPSLMAALLRAAPT